MITTDEYRAYAKGLEARANLSFKLQSAQRFTGLEQLVESRFLIVSKKYQQWVKDHARECSSSSFLSRRRGLADSDFAAVPES